MGGSPNSIRVNVLGPVELLVDGVPVPLNGPVLTRVLTLLALGPEKGITAKVLISEIWRDRRVDDAEASLQQAVRRLRRAGLEDHLPRQKSGWYRLDLRAEQVDVRRLIATAEALDGDDPPDDAELDEVLGLWRGDPTADAGIADGHGIPARKAYHRLKAERGRRTRPRLLILDDKVGHRMGSILGDYRCTVMTDLDEFWRVADRCDELFDAALVDLHLTAGDCGAEGLAVVDALKRRSSVPTVLMSYRPQEGHLDALVHRYNLFGFFIKGSNAESGSFAGLRDLVADLVSDDVEEILIQRINEDLARSERKAGKRIRLLGEGDVAKAQMEADVDRVRRVIRKDGTLAAARQAMADFNRKWLPDDR
jgi:hypothetical protein